ncbi:hypothetical protein MKX01_036201 [Papaver californicum]|nr:hypothetical protein MKX01_036201 [Papaver californicum]
MDTSQNRIFTKREWNRLRYRNRIENMTAEEKLLQNERRRIQRIARQQNVENRKLPSSSTSNAEANLTESEKTEMATSQSRLVTERERRRDRYRIRQENMTAKEKLLQNEHRRIQRRAGQQNVEKINLPSSSTSNAEANLFEHVIQQHVQEEVERIIGHVSTMSVNTTAGFLELGQEHRAPLHTRYKDMIELDEEVDGLEDNPDESHQEGLAENRQSNRANNNRSRSTLLPNRGFHNSARGFVDLHSLPRLQITDIGLCNHCGSKLFPHETNHFCCLNGKVKLPDLPVPPEPGNYILQKQNMELISGSIFVHTTMFLPSQLLGYISIKAWQIVRRECLHIVLKVLCITKLVASFRDQAIDQGSFRCTSTTTNMNWRID